MGTKSEIYTILIGCTGVALFHEIYGVQAMWGWTAGFLVSQIWNLIEMVNES